MRRYEDILKSEMNRYLKLYNIKSYSWYHYEGRLIINADEDEYSRRALWFPLQVMELPIDFRFIQAPNYITMGSNTVATGHNSIAIGQSTRCTGYALGTPTPDISNPHQGIHIGM